MFGGGVFLKSFKKMLTVLKNEILRWFVKFKNAIFFNMNINLL